MSPHPTMLGMHGIGKRFGGVIALDGVDLEVRAGEVHALIGENGAGKSTLMKVLSGAHRPDSGAMTLAGEPFRPGGPSSARRSGVSMIYQELSLAPHLTVAENVMLGRERTHGGLFGALRAREMHETVRAALDRLGRPDIRPSTPVGSLGAGDRQLVEIARALVDRARVVVLDEPTSSIGRREVASLFEVVRRLREDGVAVIYISHFLDEVRELGDRFTVLRDGRTAGTGRVSDVDNDRLIELMLGRRVEQLYPRSERTPGEPVLALEALAGSCRPAPTSFTLRRGEILGIGGLVGAGRSELLRAIYGLDAVRSGRVRIGVASGSGLRELGRPTPRRSLRHRIGLLSEDRKNEGLAVRLPNAINMTLSRLDRRGPAGRFGFLRRSELARATVAMSRRLDVDTSGPWQPVSELSGGNQQKIALGRLLHHGCDVLLLDEPTRGIDVGSKAQIYRVLDEIVSRGTSVIAVCSYIPELLGISDRVAVMHRGRLGRPRPAAEWTEHEVLEHSLAGKSEGVRT